MYVLSILRLNLGCFVMVVVCLIVVGWCGVVLFGGCCSFGVGGFFGSVVLVFGVWEGLWIGFDCCGVLVFVVEWK